MPGQLITTVELTGGQPNQQGETTMSTVNHVLRTFGIDTDAETVLHDTDATNLYVTALDLANAITAVTTIERRHEERHTLPAGESAWIAVERPRAYTRFNEARVVADAAAQDYKQERGISPEEASAVRARYLKAKLPTQ